MPLLCLASAHSRSSVPSMRKSEFATSTPLNGSGLMNGIAISCVAILVHVPKLHFGREYSDAPTLNSDYHCASSPRDLEVPSKPLERG